MAPLKDDFISCETYNNLPYILDVVDVPTANRADIHDLLALFHKHNVPQGVRIKLIHKHFDATEEEVMVFRDIPVQSHGTVSIMGPMLRKPTESLHGLNYVVDENGELQSYEYCSSPGPDMSKHDDFFQEFCSLVVVRGLQRKLGLRIGRETEKMGWTEFEIPEKRGTVMIAKSVPLPEMDVEMKVNTEWETDWSYEYDCIGHCSSHCSSHCYGHSDDLYLAGKRLEPGSVLQTIVNSAIGNL